MARVVFDDVWCFGEGRLATILGCTGVVVCESGLCIRCDLCPKMREGQVLYNKKLQTPIIQVRASFEHASPRLELAMRDSMSGQGIGGAFRIRAESTIANDRRSHPC